jgi:hypothetical protein
MGAETNWASGQRKVSAKVRREAEANQFRNLLSQLRPIASFSPFSSLPLLMGADVVADVVELRSGASSVPPC